MTATTTSDALFDTPMALRAQIASGRWTGPTAGLCGGYQQANLVVVPVEAAAEFVDFCRASPSVCPLLAVTTPGDPRLTYDHCTVDVRTMVPRYRVWEHGALVAEPTDLTAWWRADSVAFALGCSHTFEGALNRAGIPVAKQAPAVYVTDRTTGCPRSSNHFDGPLAVSMRPVNADRLQDAIAITAKFPTGHGAPIHVGDPAGLGIDDLASPDFGCCPGVDDGQVPVFWNCGVTPQLVLPQLGLEYAATHYPGHMLVLDTVVG